MKTLPELLAIAKESLAAESARISAWRDTVQTNVERALRAAEDVVGYVEHRNAWYEVVRFLDHPDTKATPESLLEYANRRIRAALINEGRSTDILERSRVLARAAAWQEVVNAIVEPT